MPNPYTSQNTPFVRVLQQNIVKAKTAKNVQKNKLIGLMTTDIWKQLDQAKSFLI